MPNWKAIINDSCRNLGARVQYDSTFLLMVIGWVAYLCIGDAKLGGLVNGQYDKMRLQFNLEGGKERKKYSFNKGQYGALCLGSKI